MTPTATETRVSGLKNIKIKINKAIKEKVVVSWKSGILKRVLLKASVLLAEV